ncbi:alpha/beta hydrolase [Jeotgalibacillus haloalkalitolerans]|uniref:Alpha/beta hydrolase-fold protein n=1 Tax=Jeotgalibacillus haloalkalitolerans TaxID=3104292 RepID=A0ABU5KIU4_9BACL|nr:alpha/beta hydrolase-fold protein [Jeotgalibacillus sp. HH7-29]MDZ5711043.1 alpha/beta hydrolase-fold protein [Jeotgalibacillus sp. HH7-29]
MKAVNWQQLFDQQESHTVTGDVRIVKDMKVPQLNTTKNIWVYLPPGYNESEKRYPVLYMHDAQNVFDQATSTGEEWGVDESLEALSRQNESYEVIVVAVDHGEDERSNEYNVYVNDQHQFGGKGEQYLAFLTETLKPWIDQEFRTLPGPGDTMIGGSSFGAYISLYAGLIYPHTFGKVMAFSLMVWQDNHTLKKLIKNGDHASLQKVFINIGDTEDKSRRGSKLLLEDAKNISEAFIDSGFPEERLRFDIVKDGRHHESTWRKEFPDAFQWLMKS